VNLTGAFDGDNGESDGGGGGCDFC